MRTIAETRKLDKMLGMLGFAQLTEAAALIQQLAYTIADHDQFGKALTACEPANRREMYDSLKPYLRFEAKPLDVYLAEAAIMAERLQLPTLGAAGELKPFKAPDIKSPEYIVDQAVKAKLCEKHLIVTCRKCTREAEFHGVRKEDAVQEARNAGWAYDEIAGKGGEICPKCLN